MHTAPQNWNLDERYQMKGGLKKTLLVILVIGIISFALGYIFPGGNDHGAGHGEATTEHAEAEHMEDMHMEEGHLGEEHADAEAHGVDTAAEGEHHSSALSKRLQANFWINNVYFLGLAVIGIFFVAIQYAAQAGWSATIIRIPLAMSAWLPIGAVLTLIGWWFVHHDVFHWTHEYLIDPNDTRYDELIAGKTWYLNIPFYLGRMIVFLAGWLVAYFAIKNKSAQEDLHGGTSYWYTLRKYSAIFLVFFAVSSSMAAWDWVMSIDPHWFSTLFGWYMFASWWVAGLSTITLIIVLLKQAGYLPMVNANHIHDLGKFMFAFSIFWTYLWFSQFLLIYYANIPEESIYFVERLQEYKGIFFINLIINFVFPFLLLMTRDAKRHGIFLQIACIAIIFGHWLDFYLMVTPGVMHEEGAFGLLEIGMLLIFGSVFGFVIMNALTKLNLVPKNHPMYQESIHHHI